MSNAVNQIQGLIDERKKQLAKVKAVISNAQHQGELLEAELRAFEQSLKALIGTNGQPNYISSAPVPVIRPAKYTATAAKERKRDLNHSWKQIFLAMSRQYPAGASYSEIVQCAKAIGIEKTESGLRTQMMIYSDQGFVDRVNPGVFALTQKGLEASRSAVSPASAGDQQTLLNG
jgi:ribosomal protein L20